MLAAQTMQDRSLASKRALLEQTEANGEAEGRKACETTSEA